MATQIDDKYKSPYEDYEWEEGYDTKLVGLCQIVLVEILNGTFTSVNVLFVYS